MVIGLKLPLMLRLGISSSIICRQAFQSLPNPEKRTFHFGVISIVTSMRVRYSRSLKVSAAFLFLSTIARLSIKIPCQRNGHTWNVAYLFEQDLIQLKFIGSLHEKIDTAHLPRENGSKPLP